MKADPTRRGAGRPPKAAQTADEALQAVRNGTAPARPRNAVEKEFHAGRRRRGRRPSTAARTWQAAASAEYLMRCDGLTGYAAAKLIGAAYGVNADNIRKYLRKLLAGPIRFHDLPISPMYRQLAGGVGKAKVALPLVVEIRDYDPDVDT